MSDVVGIVGSGATGVKAMRGIPPIACPKVAQRGLGVLDRSEFELRMSGGVGMGVGVGQSEFEFGMSGGKGGNCASVGAAVAVGGSEFEFRMSG